MQSRGIVARTSRNEDSGPTVSQFLSQLYSGLARTSNFVTFESL